MPSDCYRIPLELHVRARKPIEFLFGSMGVSASRMQMLKAAAIAPWALKPVIALLSDAVPIAGCLVKVGKQGIVSRE